MELIPAVDDEPPCSIAGIIQEHREIASTGRSDLTRCFYDGTRRDDVPMRRECHIAMPSAAVPMDQGRAFGPGHRRGGMTDLLPEELDCPMLMQPSGSVEEGGGLPLAAASLHLAAEEIAQGRYA